ncbi:MAG: hypothetical protein V2A73_11160 [Pseudomonadota bacterium]
MSQASELTRNIQGSIKKASDCLADHQRTMARGSAALAKLDRTLAEVDRLNAPVLMRQSEVWSRIEAGASLRKANAGLTREQAISVFLATDEGRALYREYEAAVPDEPTVEKSDNLEAERIWREILGAAEEWGSTLGLQRETMIDRFMRDTSKGQTLRLKYEAAQRAEQAPRREQS